MTNDELKTALLSKCPVVFEAGSCDIEYKHISAVIYRAASGKIKVSAELQDRNDNSVTVCDPVRVRRKEVRGMKNSITLLEDLRKLMGAFVGQEFTEQMRQQIRLEAVEIMNTAIAEGQAMMMPACCTNAETLGCPQWNEYTLPDPSEEYCYELCRKCADGGGFEI